VRVTSKIWGPTVELVFTTFALFMVTLVASWLFYQRIKMAQAEYEDSKESVRNITFGFTRQVQRIENEIDNLEKETEQANYMANEALRSQKGNNEITLKGLEKVKELNQKVIQIEENLHELRQEVKKLASQPSKVVIHQATDVEAPIPVQGENILKELTDTELELLQLIVEIGEGTVPEIRDKIDKTREHTARLLKKLYDQGFIDRNTSSMPYRYHIRPEIEDLIIEKKEQQAIGL
jgi:multidrug efflux pump subunit AcrB